MGESEDKGRRRGVSGREIGSGRGRRESGWEQERGNGDLREKRIPYFGERI